MLDINFKGRLTRVAPEPPPVNDMKFAEGGGPVNFVVRRLKDSYGSKQQQQIRDWSISGG